MNDDFVIEGTTLIKYNGKSKNVVIPDGVTSIGDRAFYDCNSLTNITLPDSVMRIGDYAFSGCISLTGIMFPEGVTSIRDRAFEDCGNLTSIALPDSVTSIERSAFFRCSRLESITLPDSVTRIRDGAFQYCSSLTSIRLPEGVTSIKSRTFYQCECLTSITLPANLTSIGEEAFYGCWRLKNIRIPENVERIGSSAFQKCGFFTDITLPRKLTSIASDAFKNCNWLTDISFPVKEGPDSEKQNGLFRLCGDRPAVIKGQVIVQCTPKTMENLQEIVDAARLPTEELCSGIKKYAKDFRPFIEAIICTRNDLAAAAYYEKIRRLDVYARAHGTDADTLRDTMLSDFGLDECGCRSWPLAGGTLTAKLNTDLTLTLTDAIGKVVKSVPKKGADPEEYETAKKEFAKLKKDITAAAKLRNGRLFAEFLSGSKRTSESWQKAYLKNPLLRLLARLVVWQQGKHTFTLREDGTACDASGNDYSIGGQPIGLAHPMEMDAATLAAWQNYFLDRKLKQPFEQVWEPVADAASVKPGRYNGCTVPLYTLMNKEKHGIVMEGQKQLTLTDCSAGLRLIEGHTDWINNEFEITDFKVLNFTRAANHIIVHFDKATVAGRIKKDDTSIAQWLSLFTAAQIAAFTETAIENNATNCTALLLDYKNKTFPELDPTAEFTLDLL